MLEVAAVNLLPRSPCPLRASIAWRDDFPAPVCRCCRFLCVAFWRWRCFGRSCGATRLSCALSRLHTCGISALGRSKLARGLSCTAGRELPPLVLAVALTHAVVVVVPLDGWRARARRRELVLPITRGHYNAMSETLMSVSRSEQSCGFCVTCHGAAREFTCTTKFV